MQNPYRIVSIHAIRAWAVVGICALLALSPALACGEALKSETSTSRSEAASNSASESSSPASGSASESSAESKSATENFDSQTAATANSETISPAGPITSDDQMVETAALSYSANATQTVADGTYIITSELDENKVLDVLGCSNDDGANVQIFSSNGTSAQKFAISYSGNGYYTIRNSNSGKALDVAGGSKDNGANVQQYQSNSTDAQLWAIEVNADGSYTFMNKGSGKVLDIVGGLSADGTNVQQYELNGTTAQRFTLSTSQTVQVAEGTYSVESSLKSGMVLDVSGGLLSNGTNVQLYTANSSYAQSFDIVSAGNGYYRIESVQSSKVLEVFGGSVSNGGNVQQYENNGTDAQLWSIVENGDGTYTFYNKNSGKVLDVSAGQARDGANIQQFDSNGTAAQKFKLNATSVSAQLSEGCYTIGSSVDDDAVFDVADGSTSDGANIQLDTYNSTRNQKYYLSYVGDGYYTVRNLNTGKYLDAAGAGTVNGTNVWQYSYNGSDAQIWRIVAVSSGYSFINKNSGLCVDLTGGSTANGTNVQLYSGNDSNAQQFNLDLRRGPAEGCYVISSCLSEGMAIDISGASISEGANVQLYSKNGTLAQAFKIVSVGNGIYAVYNKNSGMVLDVTGGSTIDGANVQQYSYNASAAQLWKIIGTDDGYYNFTNVGSGKYLDVDGTAIDGANIQIWSSDGQADQIFSLEETSTSQSGYSTGLSLDGAIKAEMAVDSYAYSYDQFKSYMDPSEVGSGSRRYQLLKISDGYSGLTADQLNAYIDSTLKGRTGTLHGMGQYFVDAAQEYGVNEAYLLAHAIWETGWGTSTLASGISNGSRTYYNFYGIGAFDSDAVKYGTATAVILDWSSVEKGITGGAAWIAKNYTYGDYSQNTAYKMRFNFNADGSATHQYATGLTWANNIGLLTAEIYSYSGVSPSNAFDVPVYS